jgi:F-type H+-transporting ATPase subunit b
MTWSVATGVLTAVSAASEGEAENPLLPAGYDILWSTVCFVIIFLLFWKYVMPRLRDIMAERSAQIEGGIAKAESMQAEARDSLVHYQAQLARARDEAAAIREKAESERLQIIAEARREAEAAAAAIQANATASIQAEHAKATAELRRDAGTMATDLAERIIGESLDRDRANAVVDRFIADLEQAGRS